MLKYTTTEVTFREIPDEVCLCINISGCPIHCPGCHSKELWEDIGIDLTEKELTDLISKNSGITTIGFMGGDNDTHSLYYLCKFIRNNFPSLKIAWYSGRDEMNSMLMQVCDYIKVGPYKKEFGGLDKETTNQILYKYNTLHNRWQDITYKFWRNGETSDSIR